MTSVLGLVYRLAKLGPNRIVVFLNDVVDNLGKKKKGKIWLFHILLKNQQIW